MRWVMAFVAVAPNAWLSGHLYDFGDWQMWAIGASGFWWGIFSRLDQIYAQRKAGLKG